MTRKRKFQVGDLVVLKQGIVVGEHPKRLSYNRHFFAKESGLLKKHVEKSIPSSIKVHARVSSVNPDIPAGTVGLVKEFSNVYMLEHEVLTNREFQELEKRRQRPRKSDIVKIGEHFVINLSKRLHMHVIINDSVIVFPSGAGKLFESGDDTISRFDEATIRFECTMKSSGLNEFELKKVIQKKLMSLRTFMDSVRVIDVETRDRDGNITRRDQ